MARIGLVAAIVVLPAVFCSSCWGPLRVEGYGSMLEYSTLPAALYWPLDPAGKAYGYLAGAADDDTSDMEVKQFEWSGTLEDWQSPLGSVIVLLDPAPSNELRASVRGLVCELEKRNPSMSSNVVVLAEPLGPITNGADFVAAVQRLYRVASERRMRDEVLAAFRSEGVWNLTGLSPDCVLLPVAGDATRFFVVGDGETSVTSPEGAELPVRELARAEVGEHLVGLDPGWTWIVVPDDTPPDARAALSSLFHELNTAADPAPFVTMWHWSAGAPELLDPASVRTFLQTARPPLSILYLP